MTRTLLAVDPVREDRLRWAVLASGYLHVMLLFVPVAYDLIQGPPVETPPEVRTVHITFDRHSRIAPDISLDPEPVTLDRPTLYVSAKRASDQPVISERFSSVNTAGTDRTAHQGAALRDQGSAGGRRARRPRAQRGGGAPLPGVAGLPSGGATHAAGALGQDGGSAEPGVGGRLAGISTESHRDLRIDPIPELREALGFDAPARGPGRARTDTTGVSSDTGGTTYSSVSAQETPLGRYVRTLEDELTRRWMTRDLAPADKALGIQGFVTLTYRIDSRGRILQPRIARSSGNIGLDSMALATLNERMPRIPSDVQREHLDHRVTLTYHNSLIAMGRR